MKRSLVLLAAALLVATPSGFSAPLNRKDVAGDPGALVHVDLDALRATTVGKTILDQPDVQNKLGAVQALFNFDFRSQLHGVTLYTTSDQVKEAAIIFYADFDPSRLVALAKAFPDYRCETNGSHVIHSWQGDKGRGEGQTRIYSAIQDNRVIFAKVESLVTGALDVISGAAPNLETTKALPEPGDGPPLLIQGFVRKFDTDNSNPGAAVFKMSKAVRFQLVEITDQLAATVSFEAKDADTATQIFSIAQGLVAVLRLQKDDANALKLANAITFKQDGATVVATLSLPSNQIVEMIKEGAEKKAAQAAAAATNSVTESK